MHPTKSRFICINDSDEELFDVDNVQIAHTDKYIYLGTPVSCKPLSLQIEEHLETKQPQVLKFSSFITRKFNRDSPFAVKKSVEMCPQFISILWMRNLVV